MKLCVFCGENESDEDGKYCSVECKEEDYEARCEAQDLERDLYDTEFADPTGVSALRAATPDNPRNLPCPNCGEPDRLTPKDRALGYQCDSCADRLEKGWDY